MERLEELFVRRKVWQTHVHNLNEMYEQWNCETNVFLPSELILSNFLIKMYTKSRTTSEVKFPLWKKNQHPLKKSKIFITPGLEDTVLSELGVVNIWREYLAIKICQSDICSKHLQQIFHLSCQVQRLPSYPFPRPCCVNILLQTQKEVFSFAVYLNTWVIK